MKKRHQEGEFRSEYPTSHFHRKGNEPLRLLPVFLDSGAAKKMMSSNRSDPSSDHLAEKKPQSGKTSHIWTYVGKAM